MDKGKAQIYGAAAEGLGSALSSAAQTAGSRYGARESKRRTIADILNRAMMRDLDFFNARREYRDENRNLHNQTLQALARGFVDALR